MPTASARLVVTGPDGQDRAFSLSGAQVSIGRGATNSVVLPDARASRFHARLDWDGAAWVLVDLGSANGTLHNGRPITQATTLQAGDRVQVGGSLLRLETAADLPAAEVARIDSDADLEATLAGATLSLTIHEILVPQLAVHAGSATWTVPFTGESLSIGRQTGNDLVLDLPRISRQHARIERQGDNFLLRDLNSSNGTFIAGRRVDTHMLGSGDTIHIGGAQLVFKRPVTPLDLTLVDQMAIPRGRRPIVVVPGIMGSQLWLGSDRLWPSVRRLFRDPEIFKLPDDAPLEPRGIVDEVVIVPNLLQQEQYGRLSAFLEEALGYRRGVDLMEFAYDWRQDVRDSARRLAQAIDAWEVQPPVVLIAHSLGCLVSRYYVERLGGKHKVARLLLMGGPHYGAPKIVTNLFRGLDMLPFGLMGDRLRQVIATFPSSYQILPIYDCVQDQNGQPIDVFADEAWLAEEYRPLLRNAAEFRRELGDRCSVPAVSIFGYGLKTLTTLRAHRQSDGAWRSLVEVNEPGGDVTVPERSTVLAGSEIHPVEQAHGSLYVDNDVRMRLKLELLR